MMLVKFGSGLQRTEVFNVKKKKKSLSLGLLLTHEEVTSAQAR